MPQNNGTCSHPKRCKCLIHDHKHGKIPLTDSTSEPKHCNAKSSYLSFIFTVLFTDSIDFQYIIFQDK